ncbi:hypothetical protein HPB50_005183 [Hyalomma asiaticum]|uniref:Uncharacterized protein n=1 Tax=Hyalomma asiaticum TaxID=266040 RepID=A0ACB7S2V7_HYAAI|nr:hypothetical protein HPB50_005183 [Hyalomma asiaticum]
MIKKLSLRKPILDCPTRWHSTHNTLERLTELRSFCTELSVTNREMHMRNVQWERIEGLVEALQSAKKAMLALMSEQLTIRDFYGVWIRCTTETRKVGSPFACCLADALKNQETLLVKNDAFHAGIFVNPRYNVLLTDGNKEHARRHLINTWASTKALSCECNPIDCVDSHGLSPENDDELDALFKER